MSPHDGISLGVSGLTTWLETAEGPLHAVDGVDLEVRPGECFALVGESGCGKSMTALSVLRLLPEAGHISAGAVHLGGEDLLALPEAAMRAVRGRRIAMIFQEPSTSLNPVLTVGRQIVEVIERHTDVSGDAARAKVLELLAAVGIADGERRFGEYPFQLSGGLKQRVMIAAALAADPDVLVADEPTTALDVTIQAQILDLLKKLQSERGMAVLLISHDLAVVAQMAQRVAVMYAGQIVEVATREAFFRAPQHPYSQMLFAALPAAANRGAPLAVIPGQVPALTQRFRSCRFADRCGLVFERCRTEPPALVPAGLGHAARCHLREAGQAGPRSAGPGAAAVHAAGEPGPLLLEVSGLKVHFPIRRGLLRRVAGHVKAVDGVSFGIREGRTLALVGESGCGKTTAGKALLQLIRPTAGTVRFGGRELTALSRSELRPVRAAMQIVFQDPYASLNPRMRVADILAEGIQALGAAATAAELDRRIDAMLEQVGLPRESRKRYPHEFSGGQRQRIAIARALAVEPRLIVCDEPTSALDVSVQAQILNLLKDLQDRLGLAYLFITHNIAVVGHLAHEVAVMHQGRIVEHGPVGDVLSRPQHAYTRELLASVPEIDAVPER
ncbi:MAG: dipeptide ABC transporter ATP-binding protein [Proteobacteria bacterium]|nr:dipeptide ABC transporter ATP-binding protein [Pseudomonadota bacterium]